jgi:two-component system OmpR family sensor kinase
MTSGPRWFGSIRFRLTALYSAILITVIIALGFAFSTILERQLRSDVDARIEATAKRVKNDFSVYGDLNTGEPRQLIPPPPDFYSFPSLLIQVVDDEGNPFISSDNLIDPDSEGLKEYRVLPVGQAPPGSAAPVFETAELGGVSVRTVQLPLVVTTTQQTIGAVNVGEPLIQFEQTLDHVRRLLFIGAVIGVAFATVSGWFLAGRALRPVDQITAAAATIAEGSGVSRALSTRLDVSRSGDELARLAETFNRMLNRLQMTFESQQRFIADASHELRTPLTAIRGNVDVLSRQLDQGDTEGEDLSETLHDLRRESERMGRLISDLLLLARSESYPDEEDRRALVRLDDLAQEAVRVGIGLADGQRIEIAGQSPVAVWADRDRLFQVMLILIENAVRYTPQGGKVTIRVGIERGKAVVKVTDSGPGISSSHLPHLFERFYRADSSRQRGSGGTGLGLAIAKAIVEAHDGSIDVSSRIDIGTTFTVSLPIDQTDASAVFAESS